MICYGKGDKRKCACCPNYVKCYKEDYANVIVNRFSDYSEIIIYKKEFSVVGCTKSQDYDKSRKWKYDPDGVLFAVNENATFMDLQKTLTHSRKRSLDTMYGYALSNKWDYFITLTFDNATGQKYDDNYVKYCWKIFRNKLQRRFPDIKILLVPEYHKNGGIHFHGFLSGCNLTPFMSEAKDNSKFVSYYDPLSQKKIFKLDKNGEKIKNAHYGQSLTTKYGDTIYNLSSDFFQYGFNTVVKIRPDSDNLQLVNYLTKYISKGENSNVAYNKKSFYHTNNLQFKEKQVFNFSPVELDAFLNRFNILQRMEIKKENDRFKIISVKHFEESTLERMAPEFHQRL